MGLSASSIIPLLSRWEEYLGAHPDGDIEGFAKWILAATPAKPDLATPAEPDPPPPSNSTSSHTTSPSSQNALLLNRLHRILELQAKPIAKDLGFTKPLEFTILTQIAVMRSPNKKQLCQELLIEGSTGVEIIKRLIQRGFIKEQPDPNDRRSALLSLTNKGKETLIEGFAKLSTLHADFLTPLHKEDQQQLFELLSRLNAYHTPHLPLS